MLDVVGKISWVVVAANLVLIFFWPSLGITIWFTGLLGILALTIALVVDLTQTQKKEEIK